MHRPAGEPPYTEGTALARVIVEADPDVTGPVLTLVSYREATVRALANTQPIQSRVVDTTADPWLPSTRVETTLVNGEPLLGSIDAISGDVQLATESVVVLDLHDGSQNDLDTIATRVLAFVDAASSDCGNASAVACASRGGYGFLSPEGMVFPEVVHQPPGAASEELTGRMTIPSVNNNVFTLVHEFGHLVDLFSGPGFTIDLAPDCGGSCMFECVEDTSDEAPPLSETIAQMVGMALLLTSFDSVDFNYCDAVPLFSRNGTKA